MKCPDCEREMELADVPSERVLFTIPFTEIEIRAVNFSAKEWMCIECYTDKHDEPFRAAFNAGMEKGYEQACDDGHYH